MDYNDLRSKVISKVGKGNAQDILEQLQQFEQRGLLANGVDQCIDSVKLAPPVAGGRRQTRSLGQGRLGSRDPKES